MEAPGTAPGSEELISASFIAIAARSGRLNIGKVKGFRKGDRRLQRRVRGGLFGIMHKMLARMLGGIAVRGYGSYAQSASAGLPMLDQVLFGTKPGSCQAAKDGAPSDSQGRAADAAGKSL